MLYIRADGNAEIGTGHVMRCLAIAQAARERGLLCTFVTADEAMRPLLDERGFPQFCLHSAWNDLDRETTQMEALIQREGVQLLLVDSYFVTADYLERLQRLTHVACLDDLHDLHLPCSTLINYNIYARQWRYAEEYPDTQLLLGTKYVPLRREFQQLPPRIVRDRVRDVLVTTGGSDPYDLAGQIVRQAKAQPETAELTWHIVAGRFNQHLPALEQLARAHPGVIIHRNVQRMSKLMLACDVAISAGGSTLYELCACGTPTICFAWADNQLRAVSAFGADCMREAGDARQPNDSTIPRILQHIRELYADGEVRQILSSRMQEVVDGQGAMRLISALTTKE